MQFTTKINNQDYKAFQKAATKNAGVESGSKAFFKNLALWFFIGIFTVVAINVFKVKIIEFSFPTMAVTAFFILLLFVFLVMRNMSKMQPIPQGAILGEHIYTLTDSEIIDQIGSHKSSSTYDSILNIVESDNNVFLFIDKIAGYLINKNDFSSEFQIEEVIAYVNEKCKNLS